MWKLCMRGDDGGMEYLGVQNDAPLEGLVLGETELVMLGCLTG